MPTFVSGLRKQHHRPRRVPGYKTTKNYGTGNEIRNTLLVKRCIA